MHFGKFKPYKRLVWVVWKSEHHMGHCERETTELKNKNIFSSQLKIFSRLSSQLKNISLFSLLNSKLVSLLFSLILFPNIFARLSFQLKNKNIFLVSLFNSKIKIFFLVSLLNSKIFFSSLFSTQKYFSNAQLKKLFRSNH